METKIDLGQFSMSLTVKDIVASKDFYRRLGFSVYDGKDKDKWLVLRSGSTFIGLFEGMFPQNILTFHPADVRGVATILESSGVVLDQSPEGEGPTYIMLKDPDGNTIMMDQIPEDYRTMPQLV